MSSFIPLDERSHIIAEEEIRRAPDLVVEITSPATADRNRGYKKTLYAHQGVRGCWIVDPQPKTIKVFTLGERGFQRVTTYHKGEILHSPLLAGLAVALKEVFA